MYEASARYRPPAMTAVIGGLTSEFKCSGPRGSTLYSLLKLLTSDDEWRPPQQIVKTGQAGPIMSPCMTLVIGFHRPGTYLDRAGEWSMVHRFNVPERKRKENGHEIGRAHV